MKMTFRYFGAQSDAVPLWKIKQIPGMSGVMGVLDKKAPGEVWEEDEIRAYVDEVHSAGLECEVIESVNVHEDIRMGLPTRDGYIKNYCATVRNLAKYGVKVIIYNFMPVFDWLRTDLNRLIEEDGSYSMYYDEAEIEGLSPLAGSNGFSLPGWEKERMAELKTTLAHYAELDNEGLLKNYKYFLDGVIPACEECGVKLACHPDDPAWPLFALPRLAHSEEGLARILALNPSKAHALCICTGSLGAAPENDLPRIIRRFGAEGRVGCVHIRNIKRLGWRKFREASHLAADGDLDMYSIVKAVYDTCSEVYVRPDHGRMIWGETGRPGYGLYDRALGVAYLNGLFEAVERSSAALGEEKN